MQIASQQLLKQLIALNTADEISCTVMVGYIGRIAGHEVACELIYGIVALLFQSLIRKADSFAYLTLSVTDYAELACIVVHNKAPLINSTHLI